MSWIANQDVQLIVNVTVPVLIQTNNIQTTTNPDILIEVRSKQHGSTPGAYIVQNGLVPGASYLIKATGKNLSTSCTQVRLWIGEYKKKTISFDPNNKLVGTDTTPGTVSFTWTNTNYTRVKVGFLFVNPQSGDLYVLNSYSFTRV